MRDPAYVDGRGHFGQSQCRQSLTGGVAYSSQHLLFTVLVLESEVFSDRRRHCVVIEAVQETRVTDGLVAKRLREPRDDRFGPAFAAADEDALPAELFGELCSTIADVVQEPMSAVPLTGFALFTHRRVESPPRAAADLAGTLMRCLDIVLLHLVDHPHLAEAPLEQSGLFGRGDDDPGRAAFVEEFNERVDERAVVQHQPVGHRHHALEPHDPIDTQRGEGDAPAP